MERDQEVAFTPQATTPKDPSSRNFDGLDHLNFSLDASELVAAENLLVPPQQVELTDNSENNAPTQQQQEEDSYPGDQRIYDDMGDVDNLLQNGGFDKKEKWMQKIDFQSLWKKSPETLKVTIHSLFPFQLKIFTTGVPDSIRIFLLGSDPNLTSFWIEAKEFYEGVWRDSPLFPCLPEEDCEDREKRRLHNRQMIITIYELWLRANTHLYLSKGGEYAKMVENVNTEYLSFINDPSRSLDHKFCFFGLNPQNQQVLYRLNNFSELSTTTKKTATQKPFNKEDFKKKVNDQRKRVWELVFRDNQLTIPEPNLLLQVPSSPPKQKIPKKRGRKPTKNKIPQPQQTPGPSTSQTNTPLPSTANLDSIKDGSGDNQAAEPSLNQDTGIITTTMNQLQQQIPDGKQEVSDAPSSEGQENNSEPVKKKPGRKKGTKLVKSSEPKPAKPQRKKQKEDKLSLNDSSASRLSEQQNSSSTQALEEDTQQQTQGQDTSAQNQQSDAQDIHNVTIGVTEEENIQTSIVNYGLQIFQLDDPRKLCLALKSFNYVLEILRRPNQEEQQNAISGTNSQIPEKEQSSEIKNT